MQPRVAKGMTILELMIVLAIIGAGMILVRSGFRKITRADLVENATELTSVLRRASSLAIEHGELHRVMIDLDKQLYVVEVCQGATAIQRNEKLRADPDEKKRAIERGKLRLTGMPADVLSGGDPDEQMRRETAIAGHHISDRTCVPANDSITGDATGKGWARGLRVGAGIKFKEIWVQHKDDSTTKGQVAVYFFPGGSSEKSVIELTDGTDIFTVLVYGITGRVELQDGVLRDVNDHMLRNVMGDADAKHEDQK